MKITEINDLSITQAVELVIAEWGDKSAGDFENQWRQCRADCGAAFGCFDGHKLVGLGLVSESEISFGVWGLSWLVVDPRFRRQGLASRLVRVREQYVSHASREGRNTLVQVVTPYPAMYEPLGYRAAWSWDDAKLMVKHLSSPNPTPNQQPLPSGR